MQWEMPRAILLQCNTFKTIMIVEMQQGQPIFLFHYDFLV